MQRRSFIENTIITSAGLIILPSFSKMEFGESAVMITELEKNFITPPPSSRPWTFWMWMNGNITKEGITADLEAMNRMGIGGVINFNAAVGMPRGPSEHHFIKKLPDWYVNINNKPKPGERVTFAVWKNFEKSDPLMESGLLGPVRLQSVVEKII